LGGAAGEVNATAGGGADTAGAPSGGAGAGGETSSAALMLCALGCQSESDCASDTADIRHCDSGTKRCVECMTHEECIPVASAWSVSCTMDNDCFVALGEVCVAVSGRGYCAGTPDPTLGCLFPGEVPITLPKFGVSPVETVDVCGTESGRCENHHCFTGCTDTADFCTTGTTAGYGLTCDSASGLCTCQQDSECAYGPHHCNPSTHRCDECAQSSDCAGAASGQDACVDGRCGCSSAAVCSNSHFPASTPHCE
jgi:hypothetical protein